MGQIAQTVGGRLRGYRLQRGYSQERLAELAGVHPTYIGQIERGEKNLTLESLMKVTEALGVSMSQVLEKIDGAPAEGENWALRGYELIASLPEARQRELYGILESVARYGGGKNPPCNF